MEKSLNKRNVRRNRRMMSVRARVRGTSLKPRLTVFRSNRHISAQIIDDEKQITIASAATMQKDIKGGKFGRKGKESAEHVGHQLAQLAKSKGIEAVVFDRGRYRYHGLIAKLADGARSAGLKF